MDQELQQALPGASPEVFFQLGQQAGAGTLQDMLGHLVGHPLTPEQLEAARLGALYELRMKEKRKAERAARKAVLA